MKDWESLTERGQIMRLRSLAEAALGNYSVVARRLRLVGGFTNVIFRVDTDDGRYALRVDLHQDHSDEDVEIELAWLRSLAETSDLDVVRVVPATDGRLYVHATGTGIPGTRRCVLFQWVPGKCLGNAPTVAGYHRLGQMSAGLHLQAEHFTPPYQPLTWDKVFYWPEEVDPVVVFDPERAHYLAGGRRDVLDRSIAQVESAFTKLDSTEAQVIHGDLHPDNVHVYRNRVIGFDFEDVTWGHRVQDIAITLFYERSHPDYDNLKAAFEAGYRSLATWPVNYEGELEHFMAARTIMFINYVANLHDDPSDYYEIAFPRLERFLEAWSS
jgi:Ser/Thr protein kinase RdoA (MazF antagonist)